jgi:hypothetical protein
MIRAATHRGEMDQCTDQTSAGVSEKLLDLRIDQLNCAARVDHNDRVGGGLHKLFEDPIRVVWLQCRSRSVISCSCRGKEVGVEREDHVGTIESVLRVRIVVEGKRRADTGVVAAGWIPLVPRRRWIPYQQIANLRSKRR